MNLSAKLFTAFFVSLSIFSSFAISFPNRLCIFLLLSVSSTLFLSSDCLAAFVTFFNSSLKKSLFSFLTSKLLIMLLSIFTFFSTPETLYSLRLYSISLMSFLLSEGFITISFLSSSLSV